VFGQTWKITHEEKSDVPLRGSQIRPVKAKKELWVEDFKESKLVEDLEKTSESYFKGEMSKGDGNRRFEILEKDGTVELVPW